MNQFKRVLATVLTSAFIAAPAVAHETGNPPSEETIKSWEAFAREFLPLNVLGDPQALVALLKPQLGEPFSRKFDLSEAQGVFVDRVRPATNCFVDVLPDGVLPQETCDAEGSNSLLSFNRADGSVKYMNRLREPDPENGDAKVDREAAVESLVDMAIKLGVPAEEIDPSLATAREFIMAGASSESEKPTPEVLVKLGVFATLPRCLKVDHEAFERCVPVLDGGIRSAMVDGGRREPPVVTSWFDLQFRDFIIDPQFAPRAQDAVLRDVALKLAEMSENVGDLQALNTTIGYVTNAELSAAEGSSHCPASEGDDGNSVDNKPANLVADRSYLPSLQVFALPNGWDRSTTVDTEKTNSLSTGIAVFSVPLAESPDAADCRLRDIKG